MSAYDAKLTSAPSTSLSPRHSEVNMEQHIFSIKCMISYKYRINITMGRPERKRMTTGAHIVCDIFCVSCGTPEPLGWKYVILIEYR